MRAALEGKVVLVTGAAKRVGAEIAAAAHAAGACVVVHYRSAASEAQALVESFETARPGSALGLAADLLDPASPARLVEQVVGRFGRLDALVNNASTFFATPVGRIREQDWADLMGTNIKAPLFLSQAAAPHLRTTHGCIVNITDIHAERPLRNYPLYCAAKAALAGLTRALALELAPEVRVNGVAPGPIEWPEDATFDASTRKAIIDHTLLKRCGDPSDVARAVLFLMSDAPYVTGQIVAVDGGRSAHL